MIGEYLPCGPTPTAVATGTPVGQSNAIKISSSNDLSNLSSALTFTPTPIPTNTPTPTINPELIAQAVVAAPNLSKNGEPVNLRVTLGHNAQIHLVVYNLVGEMVYQTTVAGTDGENDLLWQVQNQSSSPVASGLYIYVIKIDDSKTHKTYSGKIAVIR
jgi:hypothetical protein